MSSKIEVGFHLKDEFDNEYRSETIVDPMPDMGVGVLTMIGKKLDAFLSQCGYMFGKGYILMESLTEDELEQVYDYLEEVRNNNS